MSRPVVVLLGAGMGGRGIAHALADDATLIIVDRSAELGAALAASVGGESEVVDLLDVDATQTFADSVVRRHGSIDAVIHLVGGWQGSSTVDDGALDAWAAISPGVLGTVQVTTVAFRDALLSSGGVYVMVSSTAAQRPTAGNVAYATAKAAAETWTGGLAHSFKDSGARAVILAVKALVDDAMRSANPGKEFPGYTDVAVLGAAVDGILRGEGVANGAYVDLTKE